jgi:tRNA modification GTPase
VLALAAQIEAMLDFSEEGDVALDLAPVAADARALGAKIAAVLDNPPVERLRDGVRVVLAGAPNSGKSTLLNALAEREAAIVSPISGTTRDRIEVPVVRDGLAWLLTDTAGLLDASDDPIEAIGIGRAREAMAEADIVVWLDDAAPPGGALAIHSRADVAGREAVPPGRLAVSARTGEGLADLWDALVERSRALLPRLDRLVLNARQRDLCREAHEELAPIDHKTDPLVVAEHLRQARRAFDRITGKADVEDMLDALFGRFCIGK